MKRVMASEVLSEFWMRHCGLSPQTVLEVEEREARTLLCAGRLDMACKMGYVDSVLHRRHRFVARQLYRANIRAFVGRHYTEPGTAGKDSLAKHYALMDALIASVRRSASCSALPPVLLGADGNVIDGVHRAAVAAYLGYRLPVVKGPAASTYCDYRYFRSRGMDACMVELMAYHYLQYADDGVALHITEAEEALVAQIGSELYLRDCIVYEQAVGKREVVFFVSGIGRSEIADIVARAQAQTPSASAAARLTASAEECRRYAAAYLCGRGARRWLRLGASVVRTWVLDLLGIERKERVQEDSVAYIEALMDALPEGRRDLLEALNGRYLRTLLAWLEETAQRRRCRRNSKNR